MLIVFQLCYCLITRANELNYQKIHLHVTASQTAAMNLYRKLGFQHLDRQLLKLQHNAKNYEFDTVFMPLQLSEATQLKTPYRNHHFPAMPYG